MAGGCECSVSPARLGCDIGCLSKGKSVLSFCDRAVVSMEDMVNEAVHSS